MMMNASPHLDLAIGLQAANEAASSRLAGGDMTTLACEGGRCDDGAAAAVANRLSICLSVRSFSTAHLRLLRLSGSEDEDHAAAACGLHMHVSR